MTKRPSLRLVPFNPNDYSLGEILVKESQNEVILTDAVNSIMSLLLQWPEYGLCFALQAGCTEPIQVFLDYDHDERTPEELWIKLDQYDDYIKYFKMNEPVKLRFHLFHQCYEIQTELLSISKNNAPEQPWHIVVTAPSKILNYKQRRLPRFIITPEIAKNLPSCFPVVNGKIIGEKFSILELSPRSIKVRSLKNISEGISHLRLGEIDIPVSLFRSEREALIFLFNPSNAREFGAVFDVYRIVAFPHLRPRANFSTTQVSDLYVITKYLEKYQTTTELADRIRKITETWETLKDEMHRITADYVTIDDESKLAGASSVSLGFMRAKKPIWVFHQLCAKAAPSLLVQSGELYTWRAIYLASRSEDLDAIVWFYSKSRWLERIYVKFAFHKSDLAKLYPVSVFRKQYEAQSGSKQFPCVSEKFGNITRYMMETENAIGGIQPHFLNASGILDAIISLDEHSQEKDINELGSTLVRMTNLSEATIEITKKYQEKPQNAETLNKALDDVDRLCYFQKSSLMDFVASVEHSVAVTRRKKEKGEIGDSY